MDELTIEKSAFQLAQLHNDVADGKAFHSIVGRLGSIIDNEASQPRTKVELPRISQSFKHELTNLADGADKNELVPVNDGFVRQLLKALQVTNRTVRERSAFTVLNGLLGQRLLTDDQLQMVIDHVTDNHILYDHILEPPNRAVFGRSTALAGMAMLLYGDRHDYLRLTNDEVYEMMNKASLVTVLERDTRGFVKKSGWAHTFVQIANIYNELIQRDELLRGDKLFLMATLLERYRRVYTPLIMGETESIVTFTVNLLNLNPIYQHFLLYELEQWQKSLTNHLDTESDWTRVFNFRRLMQGMAMDSSLPENVRKYLSA
ncbi:DUF2785 domain-containing protein [Limosilactobacillus sp.]|uniref:DUF2785 domain-containing protein n=1 Tax=Limosilactobacillus sp. TaxID=2773925 RepID=UPI00345E6976